MRCRRFLFIAAWAVILAGTPAASAQSTDEVAVTEADRAAVAGCLRESADTPRACIGAVAVVCARQAGGDRREAEIDCSRREAAVWRERLEAAARVLAPSLESWGAKPLCSRAAQLGELRRPEMHLHGRPAAGGSRPDHAGRLRIERGRRPRH
jgi:hypothetical protein